ncbi:hypothetical protein G210_2409 [Candida maltosa Xu316]|uniref:Uncharacterized protein n=1 Tax=Candida maltosa (strain Xu316) TaxID=1245528 RepID=M3HIU3_CANMX|nr:hypothetical protein G210_2409 [Candida maltosa Xu316]
MFTNPIQFGPYELKNFRSLFIPRESSSKDPLFSKNSKHANTYGKFLNDLKATLASYESPCRSYPMNKPVQDSFTYYMNKFDRNVPIIIVLKSKDTLFSPLSLSHWDKPYLEFKSKILEVTKLNEEKRYEFSRISHSDIFKLALQTSVYKNTNPSYIFPKAMATAPWEEISTIDDPLVSKIKQTEDFSLIDKNEDEVDFDINKEVKRCKRLDDGDIASYIQHIPYDLTISRYYMLNVHDITKDHKQFIKLLENLDFEVVGARLSMEDTTLSEMIRDIIKSATSSDSFAYEDILKLTHLPEKNDLLLILEKLASHGLVNVDRSLDKKALYVI